MRKRFFQRTRLQAQTGSAMQQVLPSRRIRQYKRNLIHLFLFQKVRVNSPEITDGNVRNPFGSRVLTLVTAIVKYNAVDKRKIIFVQAPVDYSDLLGHRLKFHAVYALIPEIYRSYSVFLRLEMFPKVLLRRCSVTD